jgi:hypothetical protein
MDHHFIDENSIAEQYLDNELPEGVRRAFELHLVDCQECTDRILLAEMFHSRLHGSTNGTQKPDATKPASPRPALVVRVKPRQLAWILLTGGLLLVAIPLLAWLFLRGTGR